MRRRAGRTTPRLAVDILLEHVDPEEFEEFLHDSLGAECSSPYLQEMDIRPVLQALEDCDDIVPAEVGGEQ